MTTVFLSGSRSVSRLDEAVWARLDNMVESGLDIVVGDANGADKAMQAHLAKRGYVKVIVFHVGAKPRNNLGPWATRMVPTSEAQSGRDFYAAKDKEMAGATDIGFVVWDGKSAGSVQNMVWLVEAHKNLVVFSVPDGTFYVLKSENELSDFLRGRGGDVLKEIRRKIHLPDWLRPAAPRQRTMEL
ncbi:hypothetical protein [Hyphomicrobium sp. CS1BSMeth3]|uniref:hypothetical protein n=1 Tax=Hyphomicrobium sp. CS1BSMeth3 TaxID=1892844 RepID=UPI00093109C7|nr:hypothetical protein [Hyphomicrobium sp. CS1BSMeth3]